ncbi:MAG: DUF4339 domain-containing protein [Chitinophagaceae bacterium]
MKSYYLHDGQHQIGPLNFEEVKNRQINANTPLWVEGMSEWKTAGDFEEFKYLTGAPPPFPLEKSMSRPPSNDLPNLASGTELSESSKGARARFWIGGGIIAICLTAFLVYRISHKDKLISEAREKNEALHAQIAQVKQELEHKNDLEISAIKAAKLREEKAEANKRNYRNRWSDYITIKNSEYLYRRMGGIFDLKITAINATVYEMTQMVVFVHIIKTDGSIYKTEKLRFYNVPANGRRTLQVPDCLRGTSVRCEIAAIHSKEMDFCYDPSIDVNIGPRSPDDWWKCR